MANNGWTSTTLGKLIDAGEAFIQTGPFGSQLHSHDYRQQGVPVVPTEAIGHRRLKSEVVPLISPEKAAELARHRLRPGDILFARRGIQATGYSAIVEKHHDGWLCGTGAILLRLRGRSVDPTYLSFYLANEPTIQWLKAHAVGAVMPNLNESVLRRLPLRFPEISEQRETAAILSALDDKIELNRRTNETLESMARALFKSWFIDFDPVRAKAAGREPVNLAPATAALFPSALQGSAAGLVPKGWGVGSILRQADLLSGGTPQTGVAAYWDGEIPWASAKDVSQCGEAFLVRTERSITQLGVEESSTKIIPALATAIVARGATTGRLTMLGRDTAMNQTCYTLRSTVGTPFALYCHARHFIEQMVQAAHGSVFDTITTRTFETTNVVLAPVDVLRAFEESVAPLFRRILASLQQSQTLADARDALLPKLLSGELAVG